MNSSLLSYVSDGSNKCWSQKKIKANREDPGSQLLDRLRVVKNCRVMPPEQADMSADCIVVERSTSSFPGLVFTLMLTVGRRTCMINWIGELICLKKTFFAPSWISLIQNSAAASERN